MRNFACDVHTHTLFSRHAYSTIEENARAAAGRGLEVLGSADHYGCMLFEEQTLRNFQYFINVEAWPRQLHGVTLLRGCEADIVDLDGNLFGWDVMCDRSINGDFFKHAHSLRELVFQHLDYVVASVHAKQFAIAADLEQTTAMYVAALQQPKVLVLGHPGRAGVPFDVKTVVREAGQLHKLIEINEHSLGVSNRDRSWDPCKEIAVACAEEGVQIAVDSDAHISSAIGQFQNVSQMLDQIHFPQELVATRSKQALFDAMHAAGLGKDLN